MRSLVEHSGRPLSMTVQQVVQVPDRWREMVGVGGRRRRRRARRCAPRSRRARSACCRGCTASVNPVAVCPSYREIADGPLAEQRRRAARSGAPGRGSSPSTPPPPARLDGLAAHDLHRLRQALPDGPSRSTTSRAGASSVAARAAARGVSPGRGGPRPAARGRRPPAAVPDAVQLRPRQPRRRARDAAVAELGDRARRRRRPLRGDLRRQLPDDGRWPCGRRARPATGRCRSS